MLEITSRNGLDLPFKSIEQARRAYEFEDLQSFLSICYQGAQALTLEQDFDDLPLHL